MRLLCFSILLFASTIPAHAERVVSIGGAVTEMVFALGAGGSVVAVDTSSTYPKAAKALPKVGYHRTLSSEGLLSLQPDVIIMSDAAGPPAVIAQLKQANVRIVEIPSPHSIEDLVDGLEKLGSEIGRESEAREVISQLNSELQALEVMKSDKKVQNSERPKVMFVMQHGNAAPVVAGKETNADRMISLLGARNSVESYSGYKPLTPEAAVLLSPDYIITTADVETVITLPGISTSEAAKKKNIITVDTLTFLGFGPRSLKLAKELREKMSPL